jgi:hypothetical protein
MSFLGALNVSSGWNSMKTAIAGVLSIGAMGGCLAWAAIPGQFQESPSTPTRQAGNGVIAPDYLAATKELLGHGLGDPRGRRFSAILVYRDRPMPVPNEPKEFGWVSPDGKTAVMLDGVERPIIHSEPADLEATIRRLESETKPAGTDYYRFGSVEITPATPALVLLSGQPSLAGEVYGRVFSAEHAPAYALVEILRSRLQWAATTLLEERRDTDALRCAEGLLGAIGVRYKFMPEAEQARHTDSGAEKQRALTLISDIKRRIDHPKQDPFDLASVRTMDQKRRIAALIEGLDTISSVTAIIPGGPIYSTNPVCRALEDEGAAAVPALIDAYDHDTRLTRVQLPTGGPFPPRMVTVKDAAFGILRDIWPSVATLRTSGPFPPASEVRETWAKVAGLSNCEQWLLVLQDDTARSDEWVRAAQYLVKRADERWLGDLRRPSTDPKAPMTGESLRKSRGTEIGTLMAKRCEFLSGRITGSTGDVFECANALRLCHCLAKWRPEQAVPVLRETCANSLKMAETYRQSSNIEDILGGAFGLVIADRFALSDRSAAKDYESFARYVEFQSWERPVSPDFFKPLGVRSMESDVAVVGSRVIGESSDDIASEDPELAFSVLEGPVGKLMATPLLGYKPYRELLIRGLRNKTKIGTAVVERRGDRLSPTYRIKGETQIGNWLEDKQGLSRLSSDDRIDFSVGDLVVQRIIAAQFAAMPRMMGPWTAKERSDARSATIAWLSDDSVDWLAVVRSSPFYRSGD